MAKCNLVIFCIVCAAVAAAQAVFMFIPLGSAGLYGTVVRPLVYAVCVAVIFAFAGLDGRRVLHAHTANMVAVLSVTAFFAVFLLAGILFGAAENLHTANLAVVAGYLWEIGAIVIFGEIIRCKLIRQNSRERTFGIVALTAVLAFGQMSELRLFFSGHINFGDAFFTVIFPAVVLSAVMSFIAVTGSLTSVLLLSFAYSMAPYLVPIVPNVTPRAWAMITSALLFATARVYHALTSDRRREVLVREKRHSRYAKRPVLAVAILSAFAAALIAFSAGRFPIYPSAVLSDSMEGAFSRGSMVLIERLPQGAVIGEGDVIHFVGRTGVGYVHRVVEIEVHHGERVFITQGDAAETPDVFPVPQDRVLGRVRAHVPFFGYPYIFAQNIGRALR